MSQHQAVVSIVPMISSKEFYSDVSKIVTQVGDETSVKYHYTSDTPQKISTLEISSSTHASLVRAKTQILKLPGIFSTSANTTEAAHLMKSAHSTQASPRGRVNEHSGTPSTKLYSGVYQHILPCLPSIARKVSGHENRYLQQIEQSCRDPCFILFNNNAFYIQCLKNETLSFVVSSLKHKIHLLEGRDQHASISTSHTTSAKSSIEVTQKLLQFKASLKGAWSPSSKRSLPLKKTSSPVAKNVVTKVPTPTSAQVEEVTEHFAGISVVPVKCTSTLWADDD